MAHAGPLWLVLGPALAAVPAALWRRRAGLGAYVAAVAAITCAGVVALVPAVLVHGALHASVPGVVGTLRFTLDPVGLVFALVAAFAWVVASLYAPAYLGTGPRVARYHQASLIALAAMLGVVVAGDLITLYVCFEWLGLIGYLWVVHRGDAEAESAALKYLVLTLLGGFSVLVGALLAQALGGGDVAAPLVAAPGREGLRGTAAAFLVVGFGVKAGALGLHLWLPDAHTAAPAPASALLSGVLIKAGAYGILRTLVGWSAGSPAGSPPGDGLAHALVAWGAGTMVVGAAMALLQPHAKRVLAYSSVSQMGFLMTGMGAAALLGSHGAIGWTGTLLHVANHAFAKGLLFLAVGAALHATREGDLRRLGGLARRMPWTFAFVLVGAAGVAGVPGLGGFVSKSVLHHAVTEAAHEAGGATLVWAERAFVVATFGTAALLVKLVWLGFLGRPRSASAARAHEAGWALRAPMALLAVVVVVLGLLPARVAPLLARASATLGAPAGPDLEAAVDGGASAVVGWLVAPVGRVADLQAALLALAGGVLVHLLLARAGAYAWVVPGWLSLDRIARDGLAAGWTVVRRADARRRALAARLVVLARRQVLDGRAGWARLRLALPAVGDALVDAWSAWRHDRRAPRLGLARWTRRLDATRWLADVPPPFVDADPAATSWAEARDRERWVLETRHRIERHGRDLGLGVGIVFVLWLAFVALVAGGGGR